MWNMYIAGEYGGANDAFAQPARAPARQAGVPHAARASSTTRTRPDVANNDILDGRHANQHIPQFIGYLRMFEQNNEPEYHTAAKNFWDMVVPHRVYSHGGVGVGEILRKRDVIAGSLYSEPKQQPRGDVRGVQHAQAEPESVLPRARREVHELLRAGALQPDPRLATRQRQHDEPEVTYFIPVRPGERRSYGNVGTCCGGTGMENHTKYQDSIYFRSADDATLYVNLYIPSTLEWREKEFTIEQATRYPVEGASTLTVRRQRRRSTSSCAYRPGCAAATRSGERHGAADRRDARDLRHDRSASGGPATGSRSRCRSRSAPSARSTTRRCSRSSTARRCWRCSRRRRPGPRERASQRLAIQALQARRRLRAGDDAGGGQAVHFTSAPRRWRRSSSRIRRSRRRAGRRRSPIICTVRRHEPAIVFGRSTPASPTASATTAHLPRRRLVRRRSPITARSWRRSRGAAEWEKAGRFSAQERTAVIAAAGKAERDLRT